MEDVQKRPRRGSKHHVPTIQNVKCVVVGDGDVGKSSMLLTYLGGHFPVECPPGPMDGHSEFDHLTKEPVLMNQNDFRVRITLVDSYGQDEYEKLRERLCTYGDVYVLCFDVNRPSTLERLKHHWLPEIRRYSAMDTPFIIAGLKTDIRTKTQGTPDCDTSSFVSTTQGLRAGEETGASQYIECTAKNNPAAVKRVVEKAMQAAVQGMMPQDLKRSSCVLS